MKRKPWMTYVLIGLCIFVYLGMCYFQYIYLPKEGIPSQNGQNVTLLTFGAEWGPLVHQGQWWRLITAMFVHIGFAHLFLNLLTLYFIGPELEFYLGKIRYLLLYLLCGIGGNVVSLFFDGNAISAGCSTALFGLFGYYIVQAKRSSSPWMRELGRQYFVFIAMNIIFNLFDSNVSLSGHLGGLLSGVLLGFILSPKKKVR
ncbi:rhomboid family intramembrane serine protease [Catellicoccus marimammalium]|uniref:GlpG membrane protein n=1 Tax=Catellicoccus marimammalium M35/04/3 TaxID=1234409 RepID=K8ZJT6_9ENTE|nr:rhomboid family intramembrane serine protease [Catellicoccus marimammalium]EKU26858.1 GlpG membrane protein [Catellicoccus marimammalium M35/04/3]